MHRLPNQQSVNRIRFVSCLMLVNGLLITGSPVLLGWALVAGERDLTHLALGMLGVALVITIAQWLGAARVRCPLCLGTPLAYSTCIKARDARRLFGSYRLRVAHTTLLQGKFRCPYCGEFTAVQARRRRQGGYEP
jgi:hypothetical protein